jgi:predicted Zn-dependent protease
MVERALSVSRADSCIVVVEDVTDANLRWANNTLTTNGISRNQDVTVISVISGAAGVVTRQGVTVEGLVDVVRAAEHTAASGSRAEDESPLVGADASQGDWDGPPAETSIAVFDELAPTLGEAFRRAGSAGELLFGYAHHEMRSTYLGSTSGLRSRHDQPTGHVEINAKSANFARSAWAGVPTQDFHAVDLEALTGDLSRRLGWSNRSIDLAPGRYETVLPPSAVADLMIYLYWSAGARDAYDGRTVFSSPGGGTRVGERLSDVAVSLRSDPFHPSMQCPPFITAGQSSGDLSVFDNGLGLGPTSWISNGALSSLIQTRHSARLTGLPCTPYVDNLILDAAGGAGDLEHLVAGIERGLLLTCLWYIREVDPRTLLLTGLTRDGVYLVEGGEVVGAVNNFRFNESPVDLLTRIVQAGDSARTLPRERCDDFTRVSMPPIRIADFNMSSVSQAS